MSQSEGSRHDFENIIQRLLARDVGGLDGPSFEHEGGRTIGARIRDQPDKLYEALLLGVHRGAAGYDWNLGFLLPHLDNSRIASQLARHEKALDQSEGIAWGLGEAGADDPRIVDFLFHVCEACRDEDAWWCAADALEKLEEADAIDLRKRTLKGWDSLEQCAQELHRRFAVIGLLRLVRANNRERVIGICLSKIEEFLACDGRPPQATQKAVRNVVWLLERLRFRAPNVLASLQRLYERSEDASTSLRPRIIEALGQIADPTTRPLLEDALRSAKYYRTRDYAATGLGRIGDSRSLTTLVDALSRESDKSVVGSITKAMYAIRDPSKRLLARQERVEEWPENGLIADETNYWYANPQIYERFSDCEDPLGLSLDFALSLVPRGDSIRIADLATGTGRFARHIARSRDDATEIYAVDASPEMHGHLTRTLDFETVDVRTRVRPVLGEIAALKSLADGSVDAVVSSWGFPSRQWNADICQSELREVVRILKPAGVFVTVGWDETFRDQLSELWYQFIPEPQFRRETFEEWRKRRVARITSARNCHLTFIRRGFVVPLLFEDTEEAARILGHLFGYGAGRWVAGQQRREFSISAGITCDTRDSLTKAIDRLVLEQ